MEVTMAYKDLLVHLDDSKGCASRIDAAIRLAARHDAHLTGFYPIVEIPLLSYIREQIPPDVRASMDAEAKARADDALEVFRKAAARSGIAHDARADHALDTTLARVLSMHARYADLLILGQADPAEASELGRRQPEDVALSSGRPVMIVPYIGAPEIPGRDVVIAWDASREAARAVGDAMPILEQADSVLVVTVDPETRPLGHGELPGADIGTHLARHGIRVEVEEVVSGELSVADALLAHLADRRVDLLVMGAYGHSRLRELVLGGVTRKILESMPVPVVMAH
jgi:nucleotide-binding universal stress UspA family protein